MTAFLRADSVGKSYRSRRILASASLSAVPGRITLLLGRNGAGKSTLLKIAAGCITPDVGTVQLDGVGYPRARLHELATRGVFYLPDRAIFSPSFTIRQHLRALEARFGDSDASGIDEAADAVGISELLDDLPRTLSGGERRRAEIALALVRSPRYLLADEPLRGVPPKDAEAILVAFRRLAACGCGVALTGHELPLLWPAADRIVWVTAGMTREFESPADAERDPRLRTEFLQLAEAPQSHGKSDNPLRSGGMHGKASRSDESLADALGTLRHRDGHDGCGRRSDEGSADALQRRGSRADSPPKAPNPVAVPQTDGTLVDSTESHRGWPNMGEAQRMRIDEQTFRDLEIFQALGGQSLFNVLDYTETTGGRARLRQRFRQPSSVASEIIDTQLAVRFIAAEPALFDPLPDDATLKEVDRYLTSSYTTSSRSTYAARLAEGVWHRLRYRELFETLQRGVSVAVDLLRAARAVATNVGSADAPRLIWLIMEPIATFLESPDVWRLHLDERTRRIPVREVLAFDHLLRERYGPAIGRIIDTAHELDALRSMALATAARGMAFPSVLAVDNLTPEDSPTGDSPTQDERHALAREPGHPGKPVLRIERAFHPLVSDPVPNDFGIEGDRTLVFLTGPNMAGKTTYLKSCALCVYLAHLGMGVPAARMEIAPFDALFSSINTADNVQLGYSYFFSEVRRVKEAVALLSDGKCTFAVFDEPFKGTNIRDAYDASRAVITGLARCEMSILLVASHLVELAEELAALESVHLQYFDAEIRAGHPVYDYTLKEGSSSQRLGMVLLEREEVLEMLRRLGGDAGRE